jgi:hypothetical protein
VTEVKKLLEAQVPLRAEEQPDWPDVLHRAGLNGSQPRRIRRRRLLVPALVAVAVLIVGVAIAAALDGIPWWESAPPPTNREAVEQALAPDVGRDFPPSPDRTRARAVAKDGDAELVAAPVGDGGYCLTVLFAGHAVDGPSCEYQPTPTSRTYAQSRMSGEPLWLVYGRLLDPDAALIDLSEAVGAPLLVPLHYSGFFVVKVPKERWEALNDRVGPIKTLDSSGATLHSGCITWGYGPTAEIFRNSVHGLGSGGLSVAGDACRPLHWRWTFDVHSATKLVRLTLGGDPDYKQRGITIALWRAPQKDGSVCVFRALASPRPDPPTSPAGGGEVGANPAEDWTCDSWQALNGTPAGRAVATSFSYDVDTNGARWQIEGHVNPESGIAKLRLKPNRVTFVFRNGWFLGQLPKSDSSKGFPRGGPYELIGYDNNGNEVARVDLEDAWKHPDRSLIGG